MLQFGLPPSNYAFLNVTLVGVVVGTDYSVSLINIFGVKIS